MNKNLFSVSDLKEIIKEYKTVACPPISKLKKKDLIDFINKMNIDDYGGIKKPAQPAQPAPPPPAPKVVKVKAPKVVKVKAPKVVKAKLVKAPAPKLVAIEAPPKGYKNIVVSDNIPIKKSNKGKCPAKGINQKDISCDESKKAFKLLHPDRNLGCPKKATAKFNDYQARCKKDDDNIPINQNPDDIKESDKTKDMKIYEKNYNVFINKYEKLTNDVKNLGKKDVNTYLKNKDIKKLVISKLYKKEKYYYDTLYNKLNDIQKDTYDKYHSNVAEINNIIYDKIYVA